MPGPVDFSVPMPLNQSEPRLMMCGTLDHDVDVEIAAGDPRADVPAVVRLRHGPLQDSPGPHELTSRVDEHGVAPDRVGADQRALDELVGISLDQLAVVERAGFTLV